MPITKMRFNSIDEVDRFLSKIPKFQTEGALAANFDLSRFIKFCEFLGNPQRNFPVIHVAGTNGKGSTCQILGGVFRRAGYKTAVYTSPHILHFNERFKINGTAIADEDLIRFFQKYADYFKDFQLTYFEISTVIAFWWFAQSEVDLAVIEVGLGGRLDATNVVDPLLSVITSVSFDHTEILGDSIEAIAREKAGIIKAGRPVAIGEIPAKAADEIHKIAEQKGSIVHTIDKPEFIKPGVYELLIEGKRTLIRSNLATPVQAKNIALAWQVVSLVKNSFPVSKAQFIEALYSVDLGPARFTKLTENQSWYFDGAHNLEAVKAMKQSVQTVGDVSEATLVLAMMKDKLKPDVMNEFSEFKKIYYYNLSFERAAVFDDIKLQLPQAKPFPSDQFRHFLKDFDSELVIFAGSFYFYATIRERVKNSL
ncbi:MAG TPA: folylpolyglutamate synthase/dihydrofolate synthase family protein [Balneolaceae bacterium]|nr:folylpolyglutamate synthase/dihydrofolate synthase family protein [Balneolaceae bacterium]